MSTRKLLVVLAVLLIVGTAAPVLAQIQLANLPQFSGDMQMTGHGGREVTGKMYFGGTRMRMDMSMMGGERESVMIFDLPKQTTYMLMPQQNMYMEFAAQTGGRRRGPNFSDMKPYDPNNPCANEQGVTCKKLGTETVNGRTCDKWEFTGANGTRTTWIDQKLHFPIKNQGAEGNTWELKNIKEGPQSASLFEIPSNYQKMDFGGMMGGQQRPPQ